MQTGLYTENVKTALRDSREVEIRVLAQDDGERLRRLFFRLSPLSVYRRVLSPLPRPREEGLRRLLDVDPREREALGAPPHLPPRVPAGPESTAPTARGRAQAASRRRPSRPRGAGRPPRRRDRGGRALRAPAGLGGGGRRRRGGRRLAGRGPRA